MEKVTSGNENRVLGREDQPQTPISAEPFKVVTGLAEPVPGGVSDFSGVDRIIPEMGAQRPRPPGALQGGMGVGKGALGMRVERWSWMGGPGHPECRPTWQPRCPGNGG